MTKAKRELKNITFEHEGAHVALVHELQGGPANEYHTLITKASDEVTVQLSFKEFLQKFFDLWGDDADLLSAALGFETDSDYWEDGQTYKEWIESKADRIQIMKSLHSGERSPETLEDEDFKFILLAKAVFERLITSEDNSEDSNEDNLEKSSDKPTKEESTKMDEEQIKQLEADLEKAKAQAAELEAAQEELQKAKEALEAFEKAQEEQAMAEMLEVVKGYSFVGEGHREGLVAALMKSESQEVLLEVLEKAAEAIKAAATEEVGSSDAEEASDLDKSRKNVKEILKSRKTQK